MDRNTREDQPLHQTELGKRFESYDADQALCARYLFSALLVRLPQYLLSVCADVAGISHLRSFGIFDPPDGIGRIVDIDAEFLRSRRHRIAERAYFLWENRTGERWWDPVANWYQAERSESGSAG